MRFFIAMYDKDDMPYMTFENYSEMAKFFNTTPKVINCTMYRKHKKLYKGEFYTLHKIPLTDEDLRIEKGTPNLHIGAILEVLDI